MTENETVYRITPKGLLGDKAWEDLKRYASGERGIGIDLTQAGGRFVKIEPGERKEEK